MPATVEQFRKLLDYDARTGAFFWKVNHAHAPLGSEAGWINGGGYRIIRVAGECHAAHRLVWLFVHGRWPAAQIDHINHIPSDNRLKNLREATQSQNNANCRRSSRNRSGIKGVCFDASRSKWRAEIENHGVRYSLGRFDRIEDAAAAYQQAAQHLFGSFATVEKVA